MKKYIVKTGIQTNVGYDIETEVYTDYTEAQYRMEELANEFIDDEVLERDMTASQRDLYREEVNDTRGYSNSLDYVGDPNGIWYVSIDEAEER